MTERARGKTLKIPSIRTIMRAWEKFKATMKPTDDKDYKRRSLAVSWEARISPHGVVVRHCHRLLLRRREHRVGSSSLQT